MKLSNATSVLSNDVKVTSMPSVDDVTKMLQNVDDKVLGKVMNLLRPEFNIILIGDGAYGKTALIKSFLTDASEKENYKADGKCHSLVFRTNRGQVIKFNVWETSGCGFFREDPLCAGAHGAIMLFDVTNRTSYKNIPNYYRELTRDSDKNNNIVLCGNKVEFKDHMVKRKRITFHVKKKIQYYDISAARKLNTAKPFLSLARKLTDDPELQFAGEPALQSLAVIVDE